MKSKKPPIYRRKFYVLPKFQNHFMVVAAFQALLIFGGMIVPQYRILTDYIEKVQAAQQISQSQAGGEPQVIHVTDLSPVSGSGEDVQQLILLRNAMVFYSSAFIFITCIVFGFYCSHRLGGPIYKAIQYLRAYREGKKKEKLLFRDGDFFHELAEEINQTLHDK